MGGFNSGSVRRSNRLQNEDLQRLSLADVRSEIERAVLGEYVGPGGRDLLELEVVADGDHEYRVRGLPGHRTLSRFDPSPLALPWLAWQSETSMFIEIISTPGGYGGVRYWFRCPRSSCARRCSVLYRERATNARAFTCRVCSGLRYATQVLGKSELTLHRVARRLVRLRFTPGHPITRPKGMHRRTFDRLRREIEPTVKLWGENDPLMKHLATATAEINESIRRSTGVELPPMARAKLRWRA